MRCTKGDLKIALLARLSTFRFLGYSAKSYGYAFDGQKNNGRLGGYESYGPRFGKGDVVGCGLVRGILFFTKNGEFLGPAYREVRGELYPGVSLLWSSAVVANFGQSPFVFKIDWDEIIKRCGNKERD